MTDRKTVVLEDPIMGWSDLQGKISSKNTGWPPVYLFSHGSFLWNHQSKFAFYCQQGKIFLQEKLKRLRKKQVI